MGISLHRARIGLLLSGLSLLVACSSGAADDATTARPTVGGSLAQAFDASAAKASVPRDLLVAIAQVEDGLGMPAVRDHLDVDNDVPVAGPLQLRRGKLDTLALGAKLAGVAEIDLRRDADLALEAGALVLADVGAKTSARAEDLASWYAAVEEMSGFADDAHREQYAHQVFATLARGGTFDGRDGEKIVLPPHDLPPSLTIDVSSKVHALAGAEFAGAEFFPTSCNNKCTIGREGNGVKYIVIHDTEGGWTASVATLQNDPGKSVQYIVDTTGKVGQFVSEADTAWHAGNFYYNLRSVGIEHVGYSTKPYPETEYAGSAKLVDYLATKYKVPRDRAHIIGHEAIPNGNVMSEGAAPCSASPKQCEANSGYGGADHHTDPGDWEWAVYMQRFGGTAKCNDVTNLWNCSNDKTHAFRCSGGKVEVDLCNGPKGCTVMPNGQDDVCDTKPASADPPTTGNPAGTPGAPGSPTDPAAAGNPGAPNEGVKDPTNTASANDDSSGCSVSRARHRESGPASYGLTAFAAAIAVGALRRRRRA